MTIGLSGKERQLAMVTNPEIMSNSHSEDCQHSDPCEILGLDS